MNLLLVGCSYKTAPIELREQLAFDGPALPAALNEIESRYGCEAVIISTCNRVELYVVRPTSAIGPDGELLAEFVAELRGVAVERLQPVLYVRHNEEAVQHLFRVVASLDSLVVGEGQIAGQVKRAYEVAHQAGSAGAMLHTLFQQALTVAKRVRSETGISRGRASISSAAVAYVQQVFDHFGDKTILVIGAGKMGELTLRHLKSLQPRRILVTNRSPEKAQQVAAACAGQSVPWEQLDDALALADIVLSTTGAPEPIVTRRRFDQVLARRSGGTMVILDIAVPRDFDPRIHDGDRACLFNIDDLQQICAQTIKERQKHLPPAEAIVSQEVKRFIGDWQRRSHGPIIARLTQLCEAQLRAVVEPLFAKLNGKLDDKDRLYIERAFRLYQNKILHGPISALTEEAPNPGQHTLLEALRKLFRLEE
jgi:glutamyl-tRNA reductase